MPWDGAPAGKRGERVADHSCVPSEPGDESDLTIGGHTASGDAAHDGVDARVGGCGTSVTASLLRLRGAAPCRCQRGIPPSTDRVPALAAATMVVPAPVARVPRQ